MRRDRALGVVRLKTVLGLLLLAVAGYVCAKVFPPFFSNSQLKDKMWEEARFAEADERTAEQLRESIYREAQRLEIPLRREDIQVVKSPTGTRITTDYSVTVDLHFYQLHWDFHTASAR